MIKRKYFLKNKQDIEQKAQNTIKEIIMSNVENPFFSEKDLIDLAEKEMALQLKKLNSFPCRFLFNCFNKIKSNEKTNIAQYYEQSIRAELFLSLRRNIVINECYRIYELYQKNALVFTLKDIDYILESKVLISYLFKNGHLSFDFFEELLNAIKREEPKDFTKYGKGKVKQIKRDIENIMYQEHK